MRWLWIWIAFSAIGLAQVQPGTDSEKQKDKTDDSKQTLMETMTVTAERAPVKVKQTPARVSVIGSDRIARELVQDVADLVRYEPGVYLARDGARLNLNGFNIRGIGGNRVRTQIDGVRTAEQFDFPPLSVHQYYIDVETLKSVEILRGAASSLYGSDALGGQVSFQTKNPIDYFGPDGDRFFKVKSGFDSQNDGRHFGATAAVRAGQFNLLGHFVLREQNAWDNQGELDSQDRSRTRPNDQDGEQGQYLVKAIRSLGDRAQLRLTAEFFDSQVETQDYTRRGLSRPFGVATQVDEAMANDRQNRFRFSLDETWEPQNLAFADWLQWQLHVQKSDTLQKTSETRETQVGQATQRVRRDGTLDFEQQTFGAQVTLRRQWVGSHSSAQLSYGGSWQETQFEQLRDRHDLDLDTGDPDAYRGTLIFPTRYFPESKVRQTGLYAEFENQLWDGRFKWIPGIRYDRFELDPNENDAVFLASTQSDTLPEAHDDDALTGKLGIQFDIHEHIALSSQFAMGFRAPPYNSINSGFSNIAGGYQTLANPNLDPETSENLEITIKTFGQRGSALLTYFDNDYKDFIQDTVFVGISDTGLALFQPQNIDRVKIHGLEFEGDWRLHRNWWLKGAFADISGRNTISGAPLDTIEPQKSVLGIQYNRNKRLGASLNATYVAAKKSEDSNPVQGQPAFLPESYQLLDLTFYWRASDHIVLHLGGFNLGDETYWQWSQVRGRSATDPTIDRYSSPGRSISFDLQYRW